MAKREEQVPSREASKFLGDRARRVTLWNRNRELPPNQSPPTGKDDEE